MGCLPHSILLHLVRRPAGVNKRTVSSDVDTPLEEWCGRSNIGRVAARTKACYAYGGDCCGRICLFMAPHSGVCYVELPKPTITMENLVRNVLMNFTFSSSSTHWSFLQIILVLKSLSLFDTDSDFNVALQVTSHVLAYCSSCINPVLYAFLSENFRKAFRKVID